MNNDLIERAKRHLLNNIDIDELTQCCWTKTLTRDGYPQLGDTMLIESFAIKGAHRLAHHIFNHHEFNGRGDQTRHRCHNRRCINPSHISSGTALDNARDKMAAGRVPRGEAHANSKVTEKTVRTIRDAVQRGVSRKLVAWLTSLSVSQIACIVTRKSWSHVA